MFRECVHLAMRIGIRVSFEDRPNGFEDFLWYDGFVSIDDMKRFVIRRLQLAIETSGVDIHEKGETRTLKVENNMLVFDDKTCMEYHAIIRKARVVCCMLGPKRAAYLDEIHSNKEIYRLSDIEQELRCRNIHISPCLDTKFAFYFDMALVHRVPPDHDFGKECTYIFVVQNRKPCPSPRINIGCASPRILPPTTR